ncbi:hypothetical protein [Kibdelosporangium aridum]|uniref:hypothetical protein n=1 Tax=Kibdelosporangium aridum TaxID=2030 RepID=UPI0035EE45BB
MYQEEVEKRWERILNLLAAKVDGRFVKWENPSPERPELYAASTDKLTYSIYTDNHDGQDPYTLEVRDGTGTVIARINTHDASDDLAMKISDLWNSIHLSQSTEIAALDDIISSLEPPF